MSFFTLSNIIFLVFLAQRTPTTPHPCTPTNKNLENQLCVADSVGLSTEKLFSNFRTQYYRTLKLCHSALTAPPNSSPSSHHIAVSRLRAMNRSTHGGGSIKSSSSSNSTMTTTMRLSKSFQSKMDKMSERLYDVVKSGFMIKRAQNKKRFTPVNYKQRWFELTKRTLSYFDVENVEVSLMVTMFI